MSQRIPLADLEFIRDFAAFCRTKGDEVFAAVEPDSCALAQFGYPNVTDYGERGIPREVYRSVLLSDNPLAEPFSALADRLEALLVDAPVEVSGRLGLPADRAGGPADPNPVPGFGPDGRSSTGAGGAA